MPQRGLVMVDAVGILGGGGREVALDVVWACLSETSISGILLCAGDEELLGAFADHRRIRLLDVQTRGYPWRARWWFGGAVETALRHGCAAILHLGNVAVGSSRGLPRGVMVHQPNALTEPTPGWPLDMRSMRYRALRRLIATSVRRSDVVFVQSSAVAEAVREFHPRAKVIIAAPSPPASLPAPSLDAASLEATDRRILYVGSDAAHKNLHLLTETGRRFGDKMSGARFVVSLAAPPAPSPGVHHVGSLTRQQVADELERAHALVMPSLHETAGLPMLEAMQRGVPVLAADRPYARAICGEAALYFDPMDASALASACREIVDDEALRQALIGAGSARVRELEEARGDKAMAIWLEAAASYPSSGGPPGAL